MLRLVVFVILCALSVRCDDNWDPWQSNDNGDGDIEKSNDAKRLEALENYHNDLAFARLQAAEIEQKRLKETSGAAWPSSRVTVTTRITSTISEPVETKTQTATNDEGADIVPVLETSLTELPTAERYRILREHFHRRMKHRMSTSGKQPNSVLLDRKVSESSNHLTAEKKWKLSESDSEFKRVKEVESSSQAVPKVKGGTVKYIENYYFPIRAHRPALLQGLPTKSTTTTESPPSTIFNTRTVTIGTTTIPHNVEVNEEWSSIGATTSEDEKEFLALITAHTTQSPIVTNSRNIAPSSSSVEISDDGKLLSMLDLGESKSNQAQWSATQATQASTESTLELDETTTLPQSEFAALAGERLPLFVHGLDAGDSDTLKKAFAERQPVGDNWLIPYYPNGHQRQ